jgi:hypothetical protein
MPIKYSSGRLTHDGICEWCPAGTFLPTGTTFDHCHKHGWVRGEVCHSHNNRMREIDRGTRAETWQHWQVVMFLRCPECAATMEGVMLDAFLEAPGFKILTLFMSRHQYLLLDP